MRGFHIYGKAAGGWHFPQIARAFFVRLANGKMIVFLSNLWYNETDILSQSKDGENMGENVKDSKRKIITKQAAWRLNNNNYLRRENELKKVENQIIRDPSILLQVRGIGGIGKTSFCCHLFWDYHKQLANGKNPAEILYLGWISYSTNLKNSIYGQIESAEVSAENPDAYLEQAKLLFNQLGYSLLLFIDNADDMTKDEIEFLRSCACRVIVTAREQIDGMEDYPLPLFDDKQCVELYRKHSSDKKPEDEPVIQQIVETAGRHTQTVCLLARTQKESGYSAQELLTALRESGFSLEDVSVSVDSDRSEGNTEARFSEHMSKLFDIAKIREPKQIHVLKLFALLAPNQPLPRRTLNDWFDGDVLKKLIKRGWLNTNEDGDVFIHPVIAETLKSKYQPDAVDASRLINQLTDALHDIEGKGMTVQNRLLPHCVSVDKALHDTKTNDYAWFLDGIAIIMRETGGYDRALSYGERAVAVAEKVNGTGDFVTASIYNNTAIIYYRMGDYDKALEYHEKAKTIREKVLGTEHPNTAATYDNIGLVYEAMGDYDKALEYHEKAMAIRKKVLGTEHPDTANTYNNIAVVYQAMGDYDKALEYYKKDLAISEKVHGTEHPDTANTYNNIAGVYQAKGDYDKVLEYHEKAMHIREKMLGMEHPDTSVTYSNIGIVYQYMGDNDKALEFFNKALAIREKVLGTEHPDTATTYGNIGFVYHSKGDQDRALEYSLKALEIRENKLGAEHPAIAVNLRTLAEIYLAKNDADTALSYAEQARDIFAKKGLTEHLEAAINFRTLAEIYLAKNDTGQAKANAEQALAVLEKKFGAAHPDTVKTYRTLAQIYQAMGDDAAAAEFQENAAQNRQTENT